MSVEEVNNEKNETKKSKKVSFSESNETNESVKLINKITLECLLNKSQYDKCLSSNIEHLRTINKKDKKFYRKRILQLTKDLLLNVQEDNLPYDIKFAFENYVIICSQYFKTIDKSDIIQSDYENDDHIDNKPNNTLIENVNLHESSFENTTEANKWMLRSIKTEKCTLDKFVKIKSITKEQPIIPVQKEINLKDPILRNKGVTQSIGKKKNIVNNYETNQKTEEQSNKT